MSEQKLILIAEDEPALARAMQLKLERSGFAVEVASDGEVVLEKYVPGKYDLILLDLMMPKKNGFDVLTALQKLKNTTPIIVSSNLNQAEDVSRTKELGAVDYLVKSEIPISEIITKIKSRLTPTT
ncbi:MAG: response regulator [Patescibacteria group bacterium]|jgi:DNA-binding response OmpR family regulator